MTITNNYVTVVSTLLSNPASLFIRIYFILTNQSLVALLILLAVLNLNGLLSSFHKTFGFSLIVGRGRALPQNHSPLVLQTPDAIPTILFVVEVLQPDVTSQK